MKFLITSILLALISCFGYSQNLNYPTQLENIKKVTLTRPDIESNGKFATIKELSEEQTIELLKALSNAKPAGMWKFIPDFYIVFTTSENETQRLKII